MERTFRQGVMDSLPSGYPFLDSTHRPEYELLLLLRKFCTDETFLCTGKQGGEIYRYYQKTMSMLDEKMTQDSISMDSVYIIMSNLMLIAANYYNLSKKKTSETSSVFVTYDQDSKYLIQLIDKRWKIEERSRKAQEHKSQAYVKKRKLGKRIIISVVLLLVLSSIGFTVRYSKLVAEVKRLSTQKNFFQSIGDWWNQTLWHNPTAESGMAIQAKNIRSLSIVLWCALVLMVLIGFFLWLKDKRMRKHDVEADVDQLQYQFLKDVGIIADKCLKEDYSGWN